MKISRTIYIIALAASIIGFHKNILGQTTPMIVHTEAALGSVMVLNIAPDTRCDFGIKRINQDLYQITRQPEDVVFSVESTENWSLSISAANPYFTGVEDSNLRIPLDIVGYTIENKGSNWDNGLFSNIANVTKDTTIYLSNDKRRVLENGLRNNIGGSTRNSFVLRWKFDYEDDVLKTKKFTDYEILDGRYSVGIYITLMESSPYVGSNRQGETEVQEE